MTVPSSSPSFLLNHLLDLYWLDRRLDLSIKITATHFLLESAGSRPSQVLLDDLQRLSSLVKRSYSPQLLGVEQDSFLGLEPYKLSSQYLGEGFIPSLKKLLCLYPFFFDLYKYCTPADNTSINRLAKLYHHSGRFDLSFISLTQVANALELDYPYLSSIIDRINTFYSPNLPIIATQAAWHWTKIELAFHVYASIFFAAGVDKRISDHSSRIYMYLSLPIRATSVFNSLLTAYGQNLFSIPFTLLSTTIYLLVSSEYHTTDTPILEYVNAVRSHLVPSAHQYCLSSSSSDSSPTGQNLTISERLSIAVLSPDFRYHPVGRFWLPLHRFLSSSSHVSCVSLSDVRDAYTEEFRAGSTSYEYVSPIRPDEVYRALLSCNPDVVIDLAGHTADNCFPVLNHRIADLQVTYLGFFGPTFASEIDYWIVDRFVEPYLWAEPPFGEKRWQLPFCHLLYDPECHRSSNPSTIKKVSKRSSKSLRLGSFNHTRKISDAFLLQISRFYALFEGQEKPTIIFKSHSFADPAMRRWFLARLYSLDIPMNAVYLLPFASTDTSHFLDFTAIDLHLDSFPICGTTTTFDSLVMHTPVLSTPNGFYAGSVSAGILAAFGMSDFVFDNGIESLTPSLLHSLIEKQRHPEFWDGFDTLLKRHLLQAPGLFHDELTDMLKTKRP